MSKNTMISIEGKDYVFPMEYEIENFRTMNVYNFPSINKPKIIISIGTAIVVGTNENVSDFSKMIDSVFKNSNDIFSKTETEKGCTVQIKDNKYIDEVFTKLIDFMNKDKVEGLL